MGRVKGRRRDNGDGFIGQYSKGWRGYLTTDNGTRRKWFYGQTKAAVQAKMRDAKKAQERGADLHAERQTVAQWCEKWLARHDVEVTTRSKYEGIVNGHIKPRALGRVDLGRLTVAHVDDWLAELTKDGVGAPRRQTCLKTLRTALKAADNRGYLPRGNVALKVEMPRAAKRKRTAPDPDRVARLLAHTQDDAALQLFVLMCIGGGLRRGEALGLTWGAVDLETGQVT